VSAAPDFNPAHLFGEVRRDLLDAEDALRAGLPGAGKMLQLARDAATEARDLLPDTYVRELDEFEHALDERLRMI
jgi:hypothetical protein